MLCHRAPMAPSECPSNRGKPGSAICFPPVAHTVDADNANRIRRAEPNPGSEAFQILLDGSFNYDLIHGYFFAKSASTASSGR